MDAAKRIQHPGLRDYSLKALEALEAGKLTLHAVSPGTPEWDAWEEYFNRQIGQEPAVMKLVRSGGVQSMTVPAQWPEWFDPRFATTPGYRAKASGFSEPSRAERERVIAGFDRLRQELAANSSGLDMRTPRPIDPARIRRAQNWKREAS